MSMKQTERHNKTRDQNETQEENEKKKERGRAEVDGSSGQRPISLSTEDHWPPWTTLKQEYSVVQEQRAGMVGVRRRPKRGAQQKYGAQQRDEHDGMGDHWVVEGGVRCVSAIWWQ